MNYKKINFQKLQLRLKPGQKNMDEKPQDIKNKQRAQHNDKPDEDPQNKIEAI